MARETFGDRLRRLRLARKLSQADLGRLVWPDRERNVHQQIAAYESGRSTPLIENLQALARALGVSASYLRYGETVRRR